MRGHFFSLFFNLQYHRDPAKKKNLKIGARAVFEHFGVKSDYVRRADTSAAAASSSTVLRAQLLWGEQVAASGARVNWESLCRRALGTLLHRHRCFHVLWLVTMVAQWPIFLRFGNFYAFFSKFELLSTSDFVFRFWNFMQYALGWGKIWTPIERPFMLLKYVICVFLLFVCRVISQNFVATT